MRERPAAGLMTSGRPAQSEQTPLQWPAVSTTLRATRVPVQHHPVEEPMATQSGNSAVGTPPMMRCPSLMSLAVFLTNVGSE